MKTFETFQPIAIPTTAMNFSIKMFDDKYEESKLLQLDYDYNDHDYYYACSTTAGANSSFLRRTVATTTTTTTTATTATSPYINEQMPSSSFPWSSTTSPSSSSSSLPSTTTTLTREQKNKVHPKFLPADFAPSPYTVLLGRGKKCTESCGNRRLRIIATTFLGRYTKANSKEQKSIIVSEILKMIQEANQNQRGAFVREICNSNNAAGSSQWIEVSTALAREKIGQVLRDLLHTKYRSSIKNKVIARREKRLASWQDSTNTIKNTEEESSSSSPSSCSISNSSNHSSSSSSCGSSTDSSCTTSNTAFYDDGEVESPHSDPDDHELLAFTQGLFS